MGRPLWVPSHRWYRNGLDYTRFTISISVLSRAALVVLFPFGVPGRFFHDLQRPVARNLRRAGIAEGVINQSDPMQSGLATSVSTIYSE